MSMNPPAFQFYADHYLADENVQLMSLEEEGAYIRLLAFCWREGSIPADEVLLSRLCKGANLDIIRVVTKCFQPMFECGSRLVHPRLEAERKKQEEWRKKSSDGGKKSADKRWKNITDTQKNNDNKGGYNGADKGGVTLRLQSTTTITNKKEYKEKEIFNVFRTEYPGQKRGLPTEFDNLTKKHSDWREVVGILSASLVKIITARSEKTKMGQFVPEWKHLQTWINQRCWEEAPEITLPKSVFSTVHTSSSAKDLMWSDEELARMGIAK